MKELILELIKQGKTKTEICSQLEINNQEFQSYLSVHNSKNYNDNKQHSDNVTVNYTEQQKSKDLGDHVVDIAKIGVGVVTGGLLFGMFDDE
jgi:hypothetical protein